VIQEIQSVTGTTIVVEEIDSVGIVDVFADDQKAINKALDMINEIVAVPEVGTVYKGKVKAITSFGAFVEILPGREGLLHISEIEWRRLKSVDEVLKEGQEVEVKLIDVDAKTNKLKLSRKVLLPRPERN
jgi:polyribonucleotide nucleotidyltransferase